MTHDPRAVIAEDEPLLGAGLRDALAALWPSLRICALVEDGIQTLRALEFEPRAAKVPAAAKKAAAKKAA